MCTLETSQKGSAAFIDLFSSFSFFLLLSFLQLVAQKGPDKEEENRAQLWWSYISLSCYLYKIIAFVILTFIQLVFFYLIFFCFTYE